MLKLLSALRAMFRAKAPVSSAWPGEPADAHIEAYGDHLNRQVWLEGQAEWKADQAQRAARAAAWETLSEAARNDIVRWCDDLNAQGRLEDHPFFDQWLALRMKGYACD